MLFGAPDEITDMTRSSRMVRRKRLIYRLIVFGLRKGFGMHGVFIGAPEGVPGGYGELLGITGQKRGVHQPTRDWLAPPHRRWP